MIPPGYQWHYPILNMRPTIAAARLLGRVVADSNRLGFDGTTLAAGAKVQSVELLDSNGGLAP